MCPMNLRSGCTKRRSPYTTGWVSGQPHSGQAITGSTPQTEQELKRITTPSSFLALPPCPFGLVGALSSGQAPRALLMNIQNYRCRQRRGQRDPALLFGATNTTVCTVNVPALVVGDSPVAGVVDDRTVSAQSARSDRLVEIFPCRPVRVDLLTALAVHVTH